MPSQKFALRAGEEKRVEVSWRGIWKDIRVHLDGAEIGSIPSKAALEAGAELVLPDGGTLRVQLTGGMQPELHITRDGVPLPGSASDPATRVKTAAGVMYFIAGLSAIVGLAAALLHVELLERNGFGWASVATGALFAVLAFFTSRGSRVALVVGIVLYILDGLLGVVVGFMSLPGGSTPPVGSIVMHVILVMPLFRAFGAMKELKKAA
jgi:hypothetical protein